MGQIGPRLVGIKTSPLQNRKETYDEMLYRVMNL
jgi:hypothetical protein